VPEKMKKQIVAGSGAVDIGDGGIFGSKVRKKIVHNIAQF